MVIVVLHQGLGNPHGPSWNPKWTLDLTLRGWFWRTLADKRPSRVPPRSKLVNLKIKLKTTDKLKNTAWLEVNQTFGCRNLLWAICPPPAWVGLKYRVSQKKRGICEGYSVCVTAHLIWRLEYSFLIYLKIEIHMVVPSTNHFWAISWSWEISFLLLNLCAHNI